MKKVLVVSDFDGVIGDSLDLCVKNAGRIAHLFDGGAQVSHFEGYRKYLGQKSQLPSIASEDAATLRKVHRLLMRRYASDIPLFGEVIRVYKRLVEKPLICSSSYEGTITAALGAEQQVFGNIYGCDQRPKEANLDMLQKQRDFIYVTDTKTDVERCRAIGVPVVATTWGYDSVDVLHASKPDYLVHTPMELQQLFKELNLTH